MRRITVIMTVALMVASVAVVPMSGLAATGDHVVTQQQEDDSTTNETEDGEAGTNETVDNETEDENESIAPGERLSGIVGVQQAELEGEVDRRAFGLQVARAATNTTNPDEATAAVVKEQVRDMQERIAELEERKQELNESRENGSMSNGRFNAEMAELAAQTETVKQLANESENATQGLPVDLLESNGINATAIQTLKQNASDLAGPQVAEIARSIAGPGMTPGGPPEGVPAGPPADSPGENESSDRGPGQAGPPSDRPGQDGGPPADRPDENETDDRGPGQAGPPADRPDRGADDENATESPTPTPADGQDAGNETADDAGNETADGTDNADDADGASDQSSQGQGQSGPPDEAEEA